MAQAHTALELADNLRVANKEKLAGIAPAPAVGNIEEAGSDTGRVVADIVREFVPDIAKVAVRLLAVVPALPLAVRLLKMSVPFVLPCFCFPLYLYKATQNF